MSPSYLFFCEQLKICHILYIKQWKLTESGNILTNWKKTEHGKISKIIINILCGLGYWIMKKNDGSPQYFF